MIELIGWHFAFALIQHLDVATKGNGGNHKFRTLLIVPAQQRHTEAYGETQHFYATTTRDPEMAELVEGDQHTQRYQGADNHIERAHLLSPHSCSVLHGPA